MADRKISDLTALTAPASGDFLPIVDISEAAAASKNKRITIEELMRGVPDGTAAAPGIAFETDPNTGIFSPGADQLAISTGGTARLTSSTTALTSALPVDVPLGAAATPSLTFTGDLNTGIYSPGANQVAVATNGTGRLFVASDGKIGIGGTPSNPLDVFGSATLGIRYKSSGNYAGILADNTSSTGGGYFGAYQNGTQKAIFGVTAAFIGDTSGDAAIFAETGHSIRFFTNGSVTEKMRITSAGLVGVGTSSPGQLLDVAGVARFGVNATKLTTYSDSTYAGFFNGSSLASNESIYMGAGGTFFYNNGSPSVTIDSTGRVGIGTSSPQKTFHVLNPGSTYQADLRLGGTSTYYFDLSHDPTTTGKTIYNAYALSGTSHGHQFQVAGTNALLIDSSGRVGIGTTAPNRKLEVSDAGADNFIRVNTTGATKSGIEFASSGTVYSQLYFTNVSPYDLSLLQQYTTGSLILGTNSTEKARLTSSGQLLVGTSTSRAVTAGTSGNWGPRLQVTKTGIDAANIAAYSFSTYAVDLGGGLGIGPDIVLARSNSDTEGTQTAIANNMLLGRITFNGSDGTAFQSGAFIAAASDGQTWASGDCPTRLVFSTTSDSASSPTERLRITSTGQVRLAGAGITFNGDTATANELDDYEEGTFTPTIEGATTAGTATYTRQAGVYTKVGRQVFYAIDVIYASGTGTGNLRIAGLPFTSSSTSMLKTGAIFADNTALTADNYPAVALSLNSTVLLIKQLPTGGGASSDVPYDAAGQLILTGHYFV